MGEANWANRTIFTGDNLDVMRGMNSDGVDLIYLDPPFNSNRIYSAPVGSEAAAAAFKDAWTMDDVTAEEHGEVAERNPALYAVIDAAGQAHGKPMKAYLTMMGTRLLEMQRVLKSTGSIYLHCDPTAGHYLKMLMDAVFGQENFRNEIVWKRTSTHSDAKRWARVNDYILYYVGSEDATWSAQFIPYDKTYVARHYRHDDGDDRGPYRLGDIASPNPRENLMYEYKGYQPPKNGWRYSLETMQRLDDEGRIWYPDSKEGRLALKRYLNEMPGRIVDSNWADIGPLGSQAKERVGYPTQKPLALLERISRPAASQAISCSTPSAAAARPALPPSASNVSGLVSISRRARRSWYYCVLNATSVRSSPSITGKTSRDARTSACCRITARTSTRFLAGRKACARAAVTLSPSATSPSTTWCRRRAAGRTTSTTCNCCATRVTR